LKKFACVILLLIMVPAPAFAVDSKALYQHECAACHGADGTANTKLGRQLKPLPARDLRPKVLSRAEIFRVVAQGRKKTGMHAHGARLKQEEMNAIVDYVQTFHYQTQPQRGKKRFQHYCARCHGNNATGRSYPGTPNLMLSELSDIGMAHVIRRGHAGTIMGGFKNELSNSEIADIIVWLKLRRYGVDRTFSR